MFKEAVSDDLLITNPASGLKSLPEDDSITRKPFTSEEVQKLIKKAGEPGWYSLIFSPKTTKPRLRLNRCHDWPGMVLFGYYVGTRIGDIARLTWENINFERALATFVPSKTKQHIKSYTVPLHPRLVTWLKSRYSTTAQRGPVFPTLYRTTPGGKVGLSLQFVTIMEYAKIDRILVRPAAKGIKAQYARGFHSLRHTSNSALANADVSQEMRMKIIGHQSQEVNQIYTHHELEKMRTAIEKLPTI
jgi:integrase